MGVSYERGTPVGAIPTGSITPLADTLPICPMSYHSPADASPIGPIAYHPAADSNTLLRDVTLDARPPPDAGANLPLTAPNPTPEEKTLNPYPDS